MLPIVRRQTMRPRALVLTAPLSRPELLRRGDPKGLRVVADAFPLQWPEGWERTALSARRTAPYKVAHDQAMREMLRELELMGARRSSIVVSSNVPVTKDGTPYAKHAVPEDPGVAVYWNDAKFGELVVACDKWNRLHANVRAIGLALGALRAIERAGASQILNRAFSAFGALPASVVVPEKRVWWEVFGFTQEMVGLLTMPMVEARYRELAKKLHPDAFGTGSVEGFREIGVAREDALKHYGEGA